MTHIDQKVTTFEFDVFLVVVAFQSKIVVSHLVCIFTHPHETWTADKVQPSLLHAFGYSHAFQGRFLVADLGDGGVWLNVGSAVIMPEVFLKALSIAQNLGHHVDRFTTANFDMNQHYRPTLNVVKRPTSGSGLGYNIIGHHEINVPLLAAAVLDRLPTGSPKA